MTTAAIEASTTTAGAAEAAIATTSTAAAPGSRVFEGRPNIRQRV